MLKKFILILFLEELICSQTLSQMFELLAIGSLCYAQRFLGPPIGKYCKLMEENLWQRVVLETILARVQ